MKPIAVNPSTYNKIDIILYMQGCQPHMNLQMSVNKIITIYRSIIYHLKFL